MSDDGYYDDEYADFHDMMYDADPDPDLADDLAEHAAHSPVEFDNPTEELRDYFSDWEYYSDDYFDDDPALLSVAPKNELEAASKAQNTPQPSKRGRKRKLSEARDRPRPDTKEIRALRACIQGTVWKSEKPELVAKYNGDYSQPVALRLSKNIMRSAHGARKGFGTGPSDKDESWMNNLSLADMGLRTETSMNLQNGIGVVEQRQVQPETLEEGDEEDGEDQGDDASEDNEDNDEATGITHERKDSHSVTQESEARQCKNDIRLKVLHLHSSDVELPPEEQTGYVPAEVEDACRTKRRKLATSELATESKKSTIPPETSLASEALDTAMEVEPKAQEAPPKRGRGRPKKQPMNNSYGDNQLAPVTEPTRKRKLSHVESSATASTTSSRAKKIALSSTTSASAGTGKMESSKVTTKMAKTTRQTRSQNK